MKKTKEPKLIVENGEPKAVILDIQDYRELLERLEDVDDLKELEKIRSRDVKYRALTDFLSEYKPGV